MYLLDTSVVSELLRRSARRVDARVLAWAEGVGKHETYLSSLTLYEIEHGIALAMKRDRRKGEHLHAWLHGTVIPNFAGRILDFDRQCALACAELQTSRTRPLIDAMIAATSTVHSLTLVTRNVRDFEGAGVRLLNPWEEG